LQNKPIKIDLYSAMSQTFTHQYPELMKGKTILYVHGFASSAQSGTVKILQNLFPSATVLAYDLPIEPNEALELLKKVHETEKPDLIIGTSMGGMFTEMLRGTDRICVNPAFEMGKTMKEHGMTGRQVFQNPRQDGVMEFQVTKPLVKAYEDVTALCFQGITDDEDARVWGLFGDEDPIVDTYNLFRQHYSQAIHFHGEHRLNERALIHAVVPVVRWIDDRQTERHRPTILIHIDALRGQDGMPRSSAVKTCETLLSAYNLYFVAPVEQSDETSMESAKMWLEKYINVPTFHHLLFADSLSSLFGDYLITTQKIADFIGTNVVFGSAEMKTWETVSEFFSRLGGQ